MTIDIPTEGNWNFQEKQIAVGFDNHVREQLPWYDMVSGAVAHIARHYIPFKGLVYDLGCSNGNVGRLLAPTLRTRNAQFVPVDNSPAMVEMYSGPGVPVLGDIECYDYPHDIDTVICMLSLMFLPKGKRMELIAQLYQKLRPGGAIVLVDKFENPGNYSGTIVNRLTIAGKVSGGAPDSEIIAKELSLSGVQRPMHRSEFSMYQWNDVIPFFKFGEFEGWILER